MTIRRKKSGSGSSKISKHDKDLHIKLLHQFGEQGLYEKAVGIGMLQAATKPDYDIEILNLSESFLALYRRTGNEDYAGISRVLRRVAHALFRQLVKHEMKNLDPRFLKLVSST